jgi:hypothetical protein
MYDKHMWHVVQRGFKRLESKLDSNCKAIKIGYKCIQFKSPMVTVFSYCSFIKIYCGRILVPL